MPTFTQFAIPDVEEIYSYMNMLGSCVYSISITLFGKMTVVLNTHQDQRVRTKGPNNHSERELKREPWLGSWGRDGLGRGGCCASSLAQAGI